MTYGAAIGGKLRQKIDKLLSHGYHKKDSVKELYPGKFYEVVYDKTGTMISACYLERFGGGNIGSPVGSTTPVIRNASSIPIE